MTRRFNPYPGSSATSTEPNMRQELINMFEGIYPEVPKKQRAVLRKMRRPLEECPCVDPLTHEPDKDTFCPVCHGEGYLWDETFLDVYKVVIKSDVGNALKERLMGPGVLDIEVAIFYTLYDAEITKEDRIVTLDTDTEGSPVRPYRRKALYRIGTAIDLRSDNGKLEYWKIDCFEDKRKFLNGVES